ncbi:MAG: O-succinylhomoserine sulfhydrylase [Beijerinckiaceae bacterium]|nr:O-succinylhomoserine sulfhydrylase [Beijerinckiaceae bacterium]
MGNSHVTKPRQWHPETQLVHAGGLRSEFGETSEALFLTQGFVYGSPEEAEARFDGSEPGFIYSRFSNPTVSMFEARMCALEGAEAARATASGMAAVTTALMGVVKAGDHVVAAQALFGSCRWVIEEWLPRFGVATTLVDGPDLAAWKAAIRPETKAFFLETPANPTLEVIDIIAVAALAKDCGAKLIVDNVFATPLFQKPLELGADCVVYSATKHIDGQGRCLGGIILGSREFIDTHIHQVMRQTGPSISPFNAWVLLKGLKTLPVRVARQTETATTLARVIADHPKVLRVNFPGDPHHPQASIIARQMSGPSTLIAFEVKGDRAGAYRFLNALEIIKISNNLGDAKSLITHPATTTHQRFSPDVRLAMGIPEGMVRLSCGLENAQDLAADLHAALDHV